MVKNCDLDVITLFSPESPDVRGFAVSGAVRVTAYGLTNEDMVTFLRVRYCNERATSSRKGCEFFKPTLAIVGSAIEYQIGNCSPSLTSERNTIIIPYAGSYLPVLNVADETAITIEVEPVSGTNFDDKEKGIDPCGITFPCEDTKWETTGATRCNQHFEEQEEISNCGNVRWVRTQKRCGYSASVPIPIALDDGNCCGSQFMGYLFHPDETRDPDATVEIKDCDGKLHGYAYPTAGDGHTLPIEECGGTIVGYAVNYSATAPKQIMGC